MTISTNKQKKINNFLSSTSNTIKSNNAFNANKGVLSVFLVATALVLSACQSTPTSPVMQRADATFETTGLGMTKVEAQRQALESAKTTCGRYQPIVLSNDVVYNGVLDARTGRMVEQIGTVAGAVLGTSMPDLSREDDYEYTINFRCQ